MSDRPEIIIKKGCKIFLRIHDQAYLDEKRKWKRKLASLHPDRVANNLRITSKPLYRSKRCPKCPGFKKPQADLCRACYFSSRHPEAFVDATKAYKRWQVKEHHWYRLIGIDPPDSTGGEQCPSESVQLFLEVGS